jgi:hypothetical protein
MGRACSTYGGKDQCMQVLVGRPEGRNHLGDTSVDGRITLKWIFKEWDGNHGPD